MQLESERDQRRALKSSDFVKKRDLERKEAQARKKVAYQRGRDQAQASTPAPERIPAGPEYDPDLDDYHTQPRRELSPVREGSETEAAERETKRLRVTEEIDESALMLNENQASFVYLAVENKHFLRRRAMEYYKQHEYGFAQLEVSPEQFLFGFKRNVFDDRYQVLAEHGYQAQKTGGAKTKKKGRKELRLAELRKEQQEMFTSPGGSDEREWNAWMQKEACEVLDYQTSMEIRKNKADLIIPTRWVRTNKNDGLVDKDFLAKSRLVVQGFKDKALGHYRRDAPTASAIAESMCLAVTAYHGFVLLAKDIKNAYFSGKSVNREIYLEPPRSGLPGLCKGQLLRARKAIYGFAEAARLFWLALKEKLEEDGWRESKLEPALFYLRDCVKGEQVGKLLGILVTHVDDIEGGVHPNYVETASQNASKALEFATNHFKDFIFRGREVKQVEEGHIDISMKNCALSMKAVKVDAVRRGQLEADLTEQEREQLESSAGELGWIARQLRCDLAYENGCIQRCKKNACVADLVKLRQFVGQARRGADFKLRFWADVDLQRAVVLHLADFGHGTPEKDDILRYRSVGGYFIMLANPEILQDQEARSNIICFHSGQTKRVCRSTLAAEASHLAEAVEAGDWVMALLEEALNGNIDLRNWSSVIEKRQRVYVTDAKSVFDYLQKDATSTSSDKRMAIEGALLRETVRKPGSSVRWIDGMQNIANVLTKANAEKETLREFLRTGTMSLVQTAANQKLKEKKKAERQRRHQVKKADTSLKDEQNAERRAQVAREVEAEGSSGQE